MCSKERLLEIVHDFMVFDAGVKKTCRHNQYFGVKAAQARVAKREGGIIWHTQGSGKSLTMVWLAKWIREHQPDARVLLITDRTELDEQIEGVFNGVNEQIYRTTSGADLLGTLNKSDAVADLLADPQVPRLRRRAGRDEAGEDFIEELKAKIPKDFTAKGNLFVFVDEAHRTQSGKMHDAMKQLLPGGDVHRLHRHAAAQGATRKRASRPSARSSTPTSSTRPSKTASCSTCATRPAPSTRT